MASYFPPINSGGGGGGVPIPSFSVYVATNGNDSNDGVTKPVKTLTRGAQLIQAGHGGTVYFEDSVWASPISGSGLKLYGPGDPGLHSASDWVECLYPMQFTPSGNPQRSPQAWGSSFVAPGGGAIEFTEPVLWVAGTGVNMIFNNTMLFTAGSGTFPCARLGLSSPLAAWNSGTTYNAGQGDCVVFGGLAYYNIQNPNTNHQPDVSPTWWAPCRISSLPTAEKAYAAASTSALHFDTCQGTRALAHSGPVIDQGFTFEIYHNRCNYYNPAVADATDILNNSVIRMTPTQPAGANYLQYFDYCSTVATGILAIGDTQGTVRTFFTENSTQPCITLQANTADNTGGLSNWYCFDVENADSSLIPAELRAVDNTSGGNVFAELCYPCSGRAVQINCVFPAPPSTVGQYGQQGVLSNFQQDSSRRTYGPAIANYPNIAWQPPAASTFTTAPDGTNTAMSLSSALHNFFVDGTAPQVLADGDRLIFCCDFNWYSAGGTNSALILNSGSGPITFQLGGYMASANQTITLAAGNSISWLAPTPGANKNWLHYFGWLRVVTRGSGRITLQAGMDASSSAVGAIWHPFAAILPHTDTTISDSEAMMLALHAQPPANVRKAGSPDTVVSPAAGALALWPGQKIGFWDATLLAWKYLDIDNGTVRIT